MTETLLLWLATYFVHSTVLLGLAALADRAGVLRDAALAETVWRAALLGALVTASVSPLAPLASTVASAPAPAASAPSAVAPAPAAAQRVWPATVPGTIPMGPRAAAPASTATATAAAAAAAAPLRVARPTLALPSFVRGAANVVVAAWLALALAALGVLALQLRRLRRLGASAAPADAALERAVARLAHRAGVAPPAVRVGVCWSSPLVTPDRRLFVPAWALEELSDAQRDAMLAHEIAHLKRRDPWWRLTTEAIARVFALQPLNRLAARRLDALAELQCDAWAARATGSGRELAECLVACAERVHNRNHVAPTLALAMARPSSPLIERVSKLLEEFPMRSPSRLTIGRLAAGRLAAAVAAVVALGALPAVTFEVARAAEQRSVHVSNGIFGSSMRVKVQTDEGALEASIDGELEFNDAETDVASLSDEATIETTIDGVERRIELEAKGGGVARRYFVDDVERPLDADGRAWLAQAIPMLMRQTGWNAEKRVARIRAQGGAGAVLDEIARIRSDYARRVYVDALARSGALTAPEQDRTLALIGEIGSDFERRTSYGAVIEEQRLAPAQQVGVLRGVAAMESDFEQRTVLVSLTPALASEPAVVEAWGATLATVGSDFEARTAIVEMAERDDVAPAFVEASLTASAKLDSDFEHRTALESLAPYVGTQQLRRAYAESTATMSSDYEKRVALVTLIEQGELETDAALAVLDAVAKMGSDYETRSVLVELAERMPGDAALIKRYRQVARTLGDYERGQAEQALDRFAEL